MQIDFSYNLHFMATPYRKNEYKSRTLLFHLGYLDRTKRNIKFNFYQKEDEIKLLNYDYLIETDCMLKKIIDIYL